MESFFMQSLFKKLSGMNLGIVILEYDKKMACNATETWPGLLKKPHLHPFLSWYTHNSGIG